MLNLLKISNIAIIESAEIEFSQGFNVLSGETGAGKSIILDSINAVLGFRTSRELIRTGAAQAQVTALFTDIGESATKKLDELGIPLSPDGTLVVSRIIGADRNICRINNELTNVTALRELGSELISIHGQQDNRELLDNETHITYIDSMGNDLSLYQSFNSEYAKLQELKRIITSLSMDESEKARRIDSLTYQVDELEKADISIGEWDELKKRRSELQNFEKIQSAIGAAYGALCGDDSFIGAVELSSGAGRELQSIADVSSSCAELSERLTNAYYELSDISDSLRDILNTDGYSQAEMDEIESRLDLLHRLSRKYGSTEDEMLQYLEDAKSELDKISLSDEKLNEYTALYEETLSSVMKIAVELSQYRKNIAIDFAKKVCDELRFLDMPAIEFVVDFKEKPLSEDGIDSVEFLISANVGEIPKPMSKIASGGELSRIMLAFKTVMAQKDKIQTMVFDEIDTGVSGRAALKVASKLKEVSCGKQVLCVTHLAQLMAYADNHYLIKKDVCDGKTYTNVTVLDFEGRKQEIARITSSGDITPTQLQNAQEMLENARKKGIL